MKYYIKDSITNEYLIEHYGFKKIPWHDHYNLEVRDKSRYGLQIWWADRNVSILLGDHAEFGIAPIPDILVQLLKDGIIEERSDE